MSQEINSAFNRSPINPAQEAALRATTTAFDSDLLSYVIYLTQEKFKPNKDEGVTFYYGVVTNIITEDTSNSDKRDPLRLSIDGAERINDATIKSYSNRNIYIVHIPALYSILFNDEKIDGNKKQLTIEDLYKFRIENTADGIKPISIGNIVKIKFENNSSYKNGIIEAIVEDRMLQLKTSPQQTQDAQQNYNKVLECINDPIAAASGEGRTLFTTVITTKDVASLGLFDFVESFVNIFSTEAESKILNQNLNETVEYVLTFSQNAFKEIENFRNQNADFNAVKISTEPNSKYTINSSLLPQKNNVVEISVITSKQELINYYRTLFASVYSLGAVIQNNILTLTFNIPDVLESEFITYSRGRYEIIKEYGISPLNVVIKSEQIPNAQQGAQTQQEQKCQNVVTSDLYINTEKLDVWKRNTTDKILIDWFFNSIPISSNAKEIQYFSSYDILSSVEAIRLDSLYPPDKVVQANPTFYFNLPEINEINGVQNQSGLITIESIKNNLSFLRKDLAALRKYIQKNETITAEQKILILPLKWFEPKPTGATPKNRDVNSQLYYGRAVQFVVYIKQTNGKIYQIPSEIVYLYLKKAISQGIISVKRYGIGLFNSGQQYIQYERLDGTNVQTRFWSQTQGQLSDLEQKLKSVSENDFDTTVKEYVGGNYLSDLFGLTIKIRNLL